MVSPSRDQRNKWIKEDLFILENTSKKLIGYDCVNGKLLMVFDNFDLIEHEIKSLK